jgi:hypothetical protein
MSEAPRIPQALLDTFREILIEEGMSVIGRNVELLAVRVLQKMRALEGGTADGLPDPDASTTEGIRARMKMAYRHVCAQAMTDDSAGNC